MEIFASFVDISDKITDQLTIRLVLNGHPSLNTLQTTFSPIKFGFLSLFGVDWARNVLKLHIAQLEEAGY